ncbi:MAG: alpha/beta hydrolase [Asgard group archaeon]|nr:alpha/beta hydrolase [Asgard group archaeon]
MDNNNDNFNLTEDQEKWIKTFIEKGRRDTPLFCEEGVNEEIFIPVKDGELRVLHHKPEKQTTKRPIIFLPGYVAAPWTWNDFHRAHHGFAEYYYFETREKKSSKMNRHRKIQLSIKQSAADLADVIDYLGLNKIDYVLASASYGGGVVFQALIDKLIKPPTTFSFDPIAKWIYSSPLLNAFIRFTPGFILGPFRTIFTKIYLRGMQNQSQKNRMIAFVQGGEPWKFKKSNRQNLRWDIREELSKIDTELFIAHGPLDKYHPRMAYYNFTKSIPKGRFVFMNTADEDRELLAGVIATEFAKITKNDGLPKCLEQFEIKVKR